MKLLVDKMPEREDECIFAFEDGYFEKFLCVIRTHGNEWCVLEKNETCPYLKQVGESND